MPSLIFHSVSSLLLTDVDLFVLRIAHARSPIPLPRRLCRWLDRLRANLRPQVAVPNLPASIQRPLLGLLHSEKSLHVEVKPDHHGCLRGLLQVADLHRLVAVHLDKPPRLIRNVQPALQTFEDRPHDCPWSSAGSPTNLRAHTRFSHAPDGGTCARNTFTSLGSALPCTTNQDPIRVPPTVLAAARRAPPVELFFPAHHM